MKKYKVAILGATGAVGREMMKVLAERDFPIDELHPLASARSVGQAIHWKGHEMCIRDSPMAEMMSYAIDLRSMTQSRGTFTFNFVRYEDCPAAAQEKAIAEAKALAEAE